MARSSMGLMITGAAVVVAASGCGRVAESDKPTVARPAAQVSVRAAITDDGVHISPASIGGGPVRVLFVNLTTRAVRGTLAGGDDDRRNTKQRIAPGGTAVLQTIVQTGSYRLLAGGGSAKGASLTVTKPRKSSDGTLFLP